VLLGEYKDHTANKNYSVSGHPMDTLGALLTIDKYLFLRWGAFDLCVPSFLFNRFREGLYWLDIKKVKNPRLQYVGFNRSGAPFEKQPALYILSRLFVPLNERPDL